MKGYRTVVANIVMMGVSQFPEIKDVLGTEGINAIIVLANIGLRFVTTTAIGKK